MRIDAFCRKLKYAYPRTRAVKEQIEELRELLLLRKAEFLRAEKPLTFPHPESQSEIPSTDRLSEEQAEEAAVQSLGNISELFDNILQKTLYKARMEFCASAAATLILGLLTVLANNLLRQRYADKLWIDVFLSSGTIGICVGILVPFTLFLSACIQFRKKALRVSYSPGELQAALIGWIAIACICVLINYLTDPTVPWAIFPILGVVDWPLTAIIYNRFFFTRFFETLEEAV